MKIIITATGIITLTLLQACSSQPAQSKATPTDNDKNNTGNTHLVSTSRTADNDHNLATTEAQIIRELYQSGCLIEDIELNRRKQQMKITCANDKSLGSSI